MDDVGRQIEELDHIPTGAAAEGRRTSPCLSSRKPRAAAEGDEKGRGSFPRRKRRPRFLHEIRCPLDDGEAEDEDQIEGVLHRLIEEELPPKPRTEKQDGGEGPPVGR